VGVACGGGGGNTPTTSMGGLTLRLVWEGASAGLGLSARARPPACEDREIPPSVSTVEVRVGTISRFADPNTQCDVSINNLPPGPVTVQAFGYDASFHLNFASAPKTVTIIAGITVDAGVLTLAPVEATPTATVSARATFTRSATPPPTLTLTATP